MTTDAELVALLLTEARARKAKLQDRLERALSGQDIGRLPAPDDPWTVHDAAMRALDAAVQERLDAEPELRAAVLGRLEAERGQA